MTIDWTDPTSKLSEHFTVKDALWLPRWNRLANESDGLSNTIKENIVKTAAWMERVRSYINKPISVLSWYRPRLYNVLIGGAAFSQHMLGNACDWIADIDQDKDKDGKDCDILKTSLIPKLQEWELRLEDNGIGAGWIHLDSRTMISGGNRFFKP